MKSVFPARGEGPLTFVSGRVGADPVSGALVDGDVAAQTEQALRNLSIILEATGKGLADVIRVGVYLKNMDDFPVMNRAYQRFFETPYPARTTIAVAGLPRGAAVEIEEPDDDSHLHARAFVPSVGILEDRATGSACAALVASLAQGRRLYGIYELRVNQGSDSVALVRSGPRRE